MGPPPPVRAAPIRKVPHSMRSGMTRWVVPRISSTPSMVIVGVPAPCMRPPMAWSGAARYVPLTDRPLGPQAVGPRQMLVDRAYTDGTAAGQGDAGVSEPRHQGT